MLHGASHFDTIVSEGNGAGPFKRAWTRSVKWVSHNHVAHAAIQTAGSPLQLLRTGMFLLYTLLTIGVHIHAHHCGVCPLQEWSLTTAESSCCSSEAQSCCDSGCGDEVSVDLRLDQEHVAGEKLIVRTIDFCVSASGAFPSAGADCAPGHTVSRVNRPPPLYAEKYLLHCALITYG